MARSGTQNSRSKAWAWPVGILVGLAIGIPLFGSSGGVAFGIALGLVFALAFGATGSRAAGPGADGADGGPDRDAHSTDTGPVVPSMQDGPDKRAADGERRG
ncbi:hypothetical protein M8C17_26320 [Micromonospora sp. RHAY321]|uniref:hypothetical protein n=1 Tax=Micromonospora sp. RHAY321 TaxID=2944807 RepID=UPI00207D1B19|nr:hypothetical protein [Micromonospora sp. RHAY321]MCO1598669.1 hypothetical protein [Micromonospora sp. RHAY321]